MFDNIISNEDQVTQLPKFDNFVWYICNKYIHNDNINEAKKYVTELLRFLYMKYLHKDVLPPKRIDDLFRELLLFPSLYQQICNCISTSNIIDYDPLEVVSLYNQEKYYKIIENYNIILYNIVYPNGFILKSLWSHSNVTTTTAADNDDEVISNSDSSHKRQFEYKDNHSNHNNNKKLINVPKNSLSSLNLSTIMVNADIDHDSQKEILTKTKLEKSQRRCSNCYNLGHNFRSCNDYPKIEIISISGIYITYSVGMSIETRFNTYTYFVNTKIKSFLKEYACQHNYEYDQLEFFVNNVSIDSIINNDLICLLAKDIITVRQRIEINHDIHNYSSNNYNNNK